MILNEPFAPGEGDTLLTSGNHMILESLLEVPLLGELSFGDRAIRWRDPVFGLTTLMASSRRHPGPAWRCLPLCKQALAPALLK